MKAVYKIKDARMPNLGTILNVEAFLKKADSATIPDIKNGLEKKIMHQTLKLTLAYLWESKKIEYTPAGIKWIFEDKKDG
jgi:hypothetical protein